MAIDPLLARTHRLWEEVASTPAGFSPTGAASVLVSPDSKMCPSGWVGVVVLAKTALVTVPDQITAVTVRRAFSDLPVSALTDVHAVANVLRVVQVLGPAALAYLSAGEFRPVAPGGATVHQVPADHPMLRTLERASGDHDAEEAGLARITSPAFTIRRSGELVAAAGYQLWPAGTAHISVLTAPEWRGQGMARATGSAAVAHALLAGLLPQWRARIPQSRRVARALGFRELGSQLSVRLSDGNAGTGAAMTGRP